MKQVAMISLLLILVSLTACSNGAPTSENQAMTNMKDNSITLEEKSETNSIITENTNDLCTDNEETVISFKMVKTSKILSVCTAKQENYIRYRFGFNDSIEFEYPKDKENSWNAFRFSSYLRGGGASNEGLDLNYLTFVNGSYEYKIYDEYSAADDSYHVGVIVTDLNTKNETDMIGDSTTKQGSLSNLRGSDIPQEDL